MLGSSLLLHMSNAPAARSFERFTQTRHIAISLVFVWILDRVSLFWLKEEGGRWFTRLFRLFVVHLSYWKSKFLVPKVSSSLERKFVSLRLLTGHACFFRAKVYHVIVTVTNAYFQTDTSPQIPMLLYTLIHLCLWKFDVIVLLAIQTWDHKSDSSSRVE